MNSAVKNSISILHCSTVTLETWKLKRFPNLKFTNYEKFTLPNLHYSLKYYFRFPYVCILTFDFGLLWYLWSQVWITAVQRCSSSSSFVLVLKKRKVSIYLSTTCLWTSFQCSLSASVPKSGWRAFRETPATFTPLHTGTESCTEINYLTGWRMSPAIRKLSFVLLRLTVNTGFKLINLHTRHWFSYDFKYSMIYEANVICGLRT